VGEDRIRKVRAMMLRKDLLEHFPYDEDPAWYDEWLSQNPLTVSKFIEVVPSYPLFFVLSVLGGTEKRRSQWHSTSFAVSARLKARWFNLECPSA
jgi:hypothetical protein